MRTGLYILLGIFFGCCLIGGCLYFVGGVSATIPPIRTYNYAGEPAKFQSGISQLAKSDKNITYEITDTVGSEDVGFAFDTEITLKTPTRVIIYQLRYQADDSQTKIELIMAYDKTHNLGGYGIKALGMNDILNVFQRSILTKLEMKENIVLKQDKSFWTNFSIY
jgi:hypothetical protein